MRACLALAALAFLAAPLAAQSDGGLTWPEEWTYRTDMPGASQEDIYFVTMEPGFHVTTGPATILYDPDTQAEGTYRVESESFLFDPQGRREAFGVFFGGRDLDGPDQAYTYFLIRQGGEYLIKRRHGSTTSDVQGWTRHAAIASYEGQNAKNVLAVEVGSDQVTFFANGEELTSVPRSDVDVDGVVGLRVNHGLNIHVTTLDVGPLP